MNTGINTKSRAPHLYRRDNLLSSFEYTDFINIVNGIAHTKH